LILTRTDKQRNVQGISPTREEGPYVLVHGAWHGSWCWKRIRKRLQDVGHQVFTPTLTFHPSPAVRARRRICCARSGEWRSNKHSPPSGTNASRYTSVRFRSGIRSATPLIVSRARCYSHFWPQAGTTHLFEQPTNGLKRKDGRLARLAVDMK
jgi:hypothetical protein